MNAIMICFEIVSGLKVNFSKSELIGVGLDEEQVGPLANLMGCKVGALPASYLGLPLCVGKIPLSLWNPVIERVEWKLAVIVGGKTYPHSSDASPSSALLHVSL